MAAPTAADCFALATDDLVTKLYFRPGCVSVKENRSEMNQIASVMESGRVVVTNMSPAIQSFIEVDISNMRAAAASGSVYGGVTIAGFDTLRNFIQYGAVFRKNVIRVKLKGASDVTLSYVQYRIWQASFDETPLDSMDDNYSTHLLLRREL